MAKDTRPCAFCFSRANITGEHLWSDWAARLFPPRIYQFTRKTRDGAIIQWDKGAINEKSKVVCGTCNSGWMSELENKTKQIASAMVKDGTATTLDDIDVATIAAFGFLKSVIADHMQERELFYSVAQRHTFRRTLLIPEGVQMWLARTPIWRGIFKSTTVSLPLGAPDRFEFNTFTYGIGHFVIQVVGARWKKKAFRRHADPPKLNQASEWDPVSIPVWPVCANPVQWPPSTDLNRQIEDEFIKRWGNLKWGRVRP
jgi:hypothetical protein